MKENMIKDVRSWSWAHELTSSRPGLAGAQAEAYPSDSAQPADRQCRFPNPISYVTHMLHTCYTYVTYVSLLGAARSC